jgi:hypothetical protein
MAARDIVPKQAGFTMAANMIARSPQVRYLA